MRLDCQRGAERFLTEWASLTPAGRAGAGDRRYGLRVSSSIQLRKAAEPATMGVATISGSS